MHENETMFIYIIYYQTFDQTILTFTLVRNRIVFKEALINACTTVVVSSEMTPIRGVKRHSRVNKLYLILIKQRLIVVKAYDNNFCTYIT